MSIANVNNREWYNRLAISLSATQAQIKKKEEDALVHFADLVQGEIVKALQKGCGQIKMRLSTNQLADAKRYATYLNASKVQPPSPVRVDTEEGCRLDPDVYYLVFQFVADSD